MRQPSHEKLQKTMNKPKTEQQIERDYWASIARWNNTVRQGLQKADTPELTRLWLSMFING